MQFSSGVDSFRFIIPKRTFLKFLGNLKIKDRLRQITRNKTIKQYATDKFKNQQPLIMPRGLEYKIRYLNFKRGAECLSNAMIVIENSNELNDLCKKRKKQYGFYVMVVFAGLHQPSRDVSKLTYQILGRFLRRFKPYEYDVAVDFMIDDFAQKQMSKRQFKKLIKKFGSKVFEHKGTLYVNDCRKRFCGLSKICVYDKYQKQKYYHKQNISQKYQRWGRIELTFKLHEKFLDIIENETYKEYLLILDEIKDSITASGILSMNNDFFLTQMDFFKDNRRAISLNRFIF